MYVRLGKNYNKQPAWKALIGVLFIYLPLFITLPFNVMTAVFVYCHLKLIGGHNIKKYTDFLPNWDSHRYTRKNQIVVDDTKLPAPRKFKWFWLFNCKLYCPMSISLFDYISYLVKIVENWWCPFYHSKIDQYRESSVDASYWHIDADRRIKLHPEDRDSDIYNADKKFQL